MLKFVMHVVYAKVCNACSNAKVCNAVVSFCNACSI